MVGSGSEAKAEDGQRDCQRELCLLGGTSTLVCLDGVWWILVSHVL